MKSTKFKAPTSNIKSYIKCQATKRVVAQAFQPAGSGDFPVASSGCCRFFNTGLESPVNPQTRMSALPTQRLFKFGISLELGAWNLELHPC